MSGGMTVQDTGQIRCLCTFDDEDGGSSIYCESCGYWQHASCVGVANEELPELWFCWRCRPENFQFVDGGGSTLAASLGISHSPSHWNPVYEASEGMLGGSLGLEINPLAGSSRSSHSLRISNLLSPAPTPSPSSTGIAHKIVLDPIKARKRQESRRLEEERIKKLQQSHHSRRISVVNNPEVKAKGGRKPEGKKNGADPCLTPTVATVIPAAVGTPIASSSSTNPHSRRKSSATASSKKKPPLPLSPHPSSTTPRANLSAFPAQSPRPQSPTRSPSPNNFSFNIDRPTLNDTAFHSDAAPDDIQTPIDYFSSLAKGKGKETDLTPTNDRPFALQPSAIHSFPPFPLQPNQQPPFISNSQLSRNLGAGAHVNIPKGAPTGSAISRPKPLSIRSFRFDPSSSSSASPSQPFSLFLDPVPPQPPPPTTPQNGLLSAFTPTSARNPGSPSLDSLGSPIVTSRWLSFRPNAVLRPLICDKPKDDDGYAFAVYALRDLKLGEQVVLGWEVEAPQVETPLVSSSLDYIAETFITCGHCGRRSRECAEEVQTKRREKAVEEPRMTVSSPGKRGRSADIDIRMSTEKVSKKPRRDPPIDSSRVMRRNPGLGIRLPSPTSALGISSTSSSPIPATPKARLRARYEAMTMAQRASEETLSNPTPSTASSRPSATKPFLPRILTTMSPSAPPKSLDSSPLTEQSESEDEDNVEGRKGRRGRASVNPQGLMEKKGFDPRSQLLNGPIIVRSTEVQFSVSPAAHLPLDQRGPPRFRKWATKRSPLISSDSALENGVEHEQMVSSPIEQASPQVDADGDVTMDSNDESGVTSNKLDDSSLMPPPPIPASQDPTTIRSIGHLLNPAPSPRSPTPKPPQPLVTSEAPPAQPSLPHVTTDTIPSSPKDTEPTPPSMPSPPSALRLQASFVRTSSPTLNHLLNVPKTMEELTIRPSPLSGKTQVGETPTNETVEMEVEEDQPSSPLDSLPMTPTIDSQALPPLSPPPVCSEIPNETMTDAVQDAHEEVALRSPEPTDVEQVSESPPTLSLEVSDVPCSPKPDDQRADQQDDTPQVEPVMEVDRPDEAVLTHVEGGGTSQPEAEATSPQPDGIQATDIEEPADVTMSEAPTDDPIAQNTSPEISDHQPRTPEKPQPPIVHVTLASPSVPPASIKPDLQEKLPISSQEASLQPVTAHIVEGPSDVIIYPLQEPLPEVPSLTGSPQRQPAMFVKPKTPSPPPPSPKTSVRKLSFADYARRKKEKAKEKEKAGAEVTNEVQATVGRTSADMESITKPNEQTEPSSASLTNVGTDIPNSVITQSVILPNGPVADPELVPITEVHKPSILDQESVIQVESSQATSTHVEDLNSEAFPSTQSIFEQLSDDKSSLIIDDVRPEGSIIRDVAEESVNPEVSQVTNQGPSVGIVAAKESNDDTDLTTQSSNGPATVDSVPVVEVEPEDLKSTRFVDQDVLGSPLSTLGIDVQPVPKTEIPHELTNDPPKDESEDHPTNNHNSASPDGKQSSPRLSPPPSQTTDTHQSPVTSLPFSQSQPKDEEVTERPMRRPPTEPRSNRVSSQGPTVLALPTSPAVGAAEEGEITSSPTSPVQHRQSSSMSPRHGRDRIPVGPSSSNHVPTQPRSYAPPMPNTPRALSPFRRGLAPSRPPPTQPRGSLPSGPRALRELAAAGVPPIPTMPRGGMRLGSSAIRDLDDRDRDRDWDRERDRHWDERDGRDRMRDRDRDRDTRWRSSRGRGWRGGR
ncbi:hypothetical protein FRC02_000420 [Tulasnella sp. 418]|nr:hypothetical protein FRC02_000420 [Tulasnella sp. 418]